MTEYPPILSGTALQQIAALRDYLVRRARDSDASVGAGALDGPKNSASVGEGLAPPAVGQAAVGAGLAPPLRQPIPNLKSRIPHCPLLPSAP